MKRDATMTIITIVALCLLGGTALTIGIYTDNTDLCLITSPVFMLAILIGCAHDAIYEQDKKDSHE